MRARFGIEGMHGLRDAENKYRDYGIERKFGSGGMAGLKSPVREPLVFASQFELMREPLFTRRSCLSFHTGLQSVNTGYHFVQVFLNPWNL